MGFDDRLWIHLVEEHGADAVVPPAPAAPRRRVSRPVALVAAGGLAAGVAAVVVVTTSGGGQSAWSRNVLQRAAEVLAPPGNPHQVLHVVATETNTAQERRYAPSAPAALHESAWIQQGGAHRERAVYRVSGGDTYERSGNGAIVDLSTRTIYPQPTISTGRVRYTVTDGGHRLRVTVGDGAPQTISVTATELKGLRAHRDAVSQAIGWNAHGPHRFVFVSPTLRSLKAQSAQQPPSLAAPGFEAQLRALLRSGTAKVVRTTIAAGRHVIEISDAHPAAGPPTTYYVDPHSYAPVEVVTGNYLSAKATTTLRISTYERMSLAGHEHQLRPTVPPGATVDHSLAAYGKQIVQTPF